MSCKWIWTPGRDLDIKHCFISCLKTVTVYQLWNACVYKYSRKLWQNQGQKLCVCVCVYKEYYSTRLRHSGVNTSATLSCPLTMRLAHKHRRAHTHTMLDNAFLWWQMIALDHKQHICCLSQSSSKVFFSCVLYFQIGTGRHTNSLRKIQSSCLDIFFF